MFGFWVIEDVVVEIVSFESGALISLVQRYLMNPVMLNFRIIHNEVPLNFQNEKTRGGTLFERGIEFSGAVNTVAAQRRQRSWLQVSIKMSSGNS